MNYDSVVHLDNVTCEDCLDLYIRKNMYTIINDGKIINFEKEINKNEHKRHNDKKSKRKCNYSNNRQR